MIAGIINTPRIPAAVSPPSDVSVNVAGLSVGAHSANEFAGFTSPATTVFTSSNWGSASTNYLVEQDEAEVALKTTSSHRDVEVTTWCRRGFVYLRVTGGKAIYFTISGETDVFEVGIATGLGGSESRIAIYAGTLTMIPGYDGNDTAGDTFTFGASGWDIYAKFNGVEFYRSKTMYHIASGATWLRGVSGVYGFRNVSVDFLNLATLYSYPLNNTIDMRDFGMKSSATTGSMTASSSTLTVASSSGFSIGDPIIVEVGGESGGGLRGSVGVGGAIPTLSYASVAAMNADTTKPNATNCWVVATGNIYGSFGGVWSQRTDYYFSRVMPRALWATITNIVGNTITLDTPATVATTGANVYFDNSDLLTKIFDIPAGFTALTPTDRHVLLPVGNFAVSENFSIAERTRWWIEGAGTSAITIFSPKGSPCSSCTLRSCTSCLITDLTFQQNMRNQGYALKEFAGSLSAFVPTCQFDSTAFSQAQRVNGHNTWLQAVGGGFPTDCWAYDCHTVLDDGTQQYIQWQYQFSNGTGGGAVNCSVTSPYITGGFEFFAHTGGTFRDCTCINATISVNDAGNFLYENFTITITANSQISEDSFSHSNPIINCNTNIGSSNAALGGIILNPTIIQEGVINASNDILQFMIVGGAYENIQLIGTYPDAANPKGLFQSIDYIGGGLVTGGIKVRNAGTGTLIDGMRFIGGTETNHSQVYVESGTITVQNSVLETTQGSGITEINNQTNAEWEANH